MKKCQNEKIVKHINSLNKIQNERKLVALTINGFDFENFIKSEFEKPENKAMYSMVDALAKNKKINILLIEYKSGQKHHHDYKELVGKKINSYFGTDMNSNEPLFSNSYKVGQKYFDSVRCLNTYSECEKCCVSECLLKEFNTYKYIHVEDDKYFRGFVDVARKLKSYFKEKHNIDFQAYSYKDFNKNRCGIVDIDK